jgi:hypothetical protein
MSRAIDFNVGCHSAGPGMAMPHVLDFNIGCHSETMGMAMLRVRDFKVVCHSEVDPTRVGRGICVSANTARIADTSSLYA